MSIVSSLPNQIALRTKRLLLRPWCDDDRAAFAAMSADPEVMAYFPAVLSREESDARVDRIEAEFAERGWGLWAVEVPGELPFAGFVGLSIPRFEASFMPCVELGWRLARGVWGRGYATEAARAAVAFGFEQLGLSEIVSCTAVPNERSWRAMERLGMTHDPHEDFDYPALPDGHWLRRHVLYRLRQPEISAGRTSAVA